MDLLSTYVYILHFHIFTLDLYVRSLNTITNEDPLPSTTTLTHFLISPSVDVDINK